MNLKGKIYIYWVFTGSRRSWVKRELEGKSNYLLKDNIHTEQLIKPKSRVGLFIY